MKNVLLIAGGGTLGTYTAKELLRLGHNVDVICLEDKENSPKLTYLKANATVDYLHKLFEKKHYDGIINFIHYKEVSDYEPYHELLTTSCEHLIFLSSYRIYAKSKHPVTEESPILLDVIKDKDFLEKEKYSLSKARCERFIRNSSAPKNWTFVRPVISFSDRRLDLIMHTGHQVIDAAKNGETLTLPLEAKNLTAGLDWSGNTGKLIANLLFKKECIGEAYTISSAPNMTWGQIADIYSRLTGVTFKWEPADYPRELWHWHFDRAYDRKVDNTKVLKATGLKSEDFKSIEDGIKIELEKLNFSK
ncbi:MAG: hypothetical protein IJF32_12810 [Oscillospiraceae bacterium]|nr:hypothetical protein [Oscillospiraceae bacterium]